MTTQCVGLEVSAAKKGSKLSVRSILVSVKNTLAKWQHNYSSRIYLEELSDHMLKDIGVSRSEARDEASKPFWRP